MGAAVCEPGWRRAAALYYGMGAVSTRQIDTAMTPVLLWKPIYWESNPMVCSERRYYAFVDRPQEAN
jgi:hypothetical protein